MPIATYPNIPLSQSSSFTYDQRIIESKFGDGYSQRAPDGLNSFFTTIRIVHDNLNASEYQTLVNFWNTVGKVLPFTITDPTTSITYKARFSDTLNVSASAGNIYSVTVTAIQTFDLTS